MILADVAGRAADLAQIALGVGILRPLFRWLERERPTRFARTRHEPFAANGSTFVRAVGALEKAAFVAKMLGTDGGYTSERGSDRDRETPREGCEVIFAGDLLCPGRLDELSLSSALRARIRRAACLVVNLEAVVGMHRNAIAPVLSGEGLSQLLAYNRDPNDARWVSRLAVDELAAFLRGISVPRVVASVANNHTLDDGLDGFARTVRLLRGLGITVVGDARDDEGVSVIEIGPHRIGLVAMAYGSNRSSRSPDVHLQFDQVPYRLSRERMRALVARLRARGATHPIALLHWGYEHEHEPAPEQEECVAVLLDAGFSAVIGHHPHILQRSEWDGEHWVSYSLGDFVGGDRTIWSRIGSIVSLRLGPEGSVTGEMIATAQSPFWRPHETMLLEEASALERWIFDRFFARKNRRTRPLSLAPMEAA